MQVIIFSFITILYIFTRLPVTRWVTNTVSDQFDRNAILTVYIYIYIYSHSVSRIRTEGKNFSIYFLWQTIY